MALWFYLQYPACDTYYVLHKWTQINMALIFPVSSNLSDPNLLYPTLTETSQKS